MRQPSLYYRATGNQVSNSVQQKLLSVRIEFQLTLLILFLSKARLISSTPVLSPVSASADGIAVSSARPGIIVSSLIPAKGSLSRKKNVESVVVLRGTFLGEIFWFSS